MDKTELEEYNHWFWDETYVFHYKNSPGNYPEYLEYFNIHKMDDCLEEARKNIEYKEVNLYVVSGKTMDDAYCRRGYYLTYLLNKYFRDVFEERHFRTGFMGQHRYNRVILTNTIYTEIMNFINDNELLHIKDLLIELTAIAQNTYHDEVLMYVDNGFEKSIAKIDSEIEKLKTLFDIVSDRNQRDSRNRTHPPELIGITAKFNKSVGQKISDKSIKLTDSWIIRDFVKYYMQHFEQDLPFKGDWRKSLEHYRKNIYWDANEKLKFNFSLSVAIYNMFTKEKIICDDSSKNRTKILRFIVNFFDLALIPFKTRENDIELTQVQKIGHVRNYIKRHLKDPSIAYLSLPPNKDKLLKYFDIDFINLASDEKGAETLGQVYFICNRFNILNIKDIISDLAHISQSFRLKTLFSSHQLLTESNPNPPCNDYKALRSLIKGLNGKKNLTQFKFKIESEDVEYSLNEPLPLYILERALNNHFKNYKEDFEHDIIETEPVEGLNTQVFGNRLHLPEERFIVRFVKAFYDYLSNEVKLTHCPDYLLVENYYTIIALTLQDNWFFYQKMDSENFIIEKVKHWHKLSQSK